jgi:hypothetical protein
MQYTPLSSITRSTEMKLSAAALAVSPLQDGTPLTFGLENGVRVVTPCSAAAGESLAGFSFAQTSAAPVLPSDAVRVESLVSDADGEVVLAKTPLVGQVVVLNALTRAPIAVASSAANVLTLTSAEDTAVEVTYRHALTVKEAVSLVGNQQPGGYTGAMYGQTGVAQQGTIYTDRIDASVNWAAATGVKLAAGGILTNQAGSGVAVNAKVVAVPTADYPFLGLQFDTI